MSDAEKFAKKFLEDMLTFFDLNLEVESMVEDNVVNLSVPTSTMNGFLIGERGNNLRSIQYLVNNAVSSQGLDARVSVDVADYKKQRADRLADDVKKWAAAVLDTGAPMDVAPMNAADRRTVHKTIGEIDGVETESIGEGRDRHVVIKKS